MPSLRIALFSLAALALMLQSACVAAPPAPITLKEQLNQTYGPQVLYYPISAGKGECAPDAIRLAGPSGPVASQLINVVKHEGGDSVKTATLAFIVKDVAPLSSQVFTASFNASAPKLGTDLKITPGENMVEVANDALGARFRVGSGKPAAPIALKDVPGPILALRTGSGAWAGGATLSGDALVKAWNSRLIENGPVLATSEYTLELTDGNTLTLRATILAGDNAIRWHMDVKDDRPDLSLVLKLPPVPGVKQATLPKGYGQWARDRTAPVAPGATPVAFLSPDSSVVNIFADCPPIIRLIGENNAETALLSRDPGAWVEPKPMTYGGFKSWALDWIPQSWENWKRKRIAVLYEADGSILLSATLAKGRRVWLSGTGLPRVGDELTSIKDMTLDWPEDAKRPAPRVFLSASDIDAAWKRADADPAYAKVLSQSRWAGEALRVLHKPAAQRTKAETDAVVENLRKHLGMLGNYDVMRNAVAVICLYDAAINSDLVTPADRAVFRAQMAYLGYLLDSPRAWSMERGFHSGNPNMTMSYTLSKGILACALSDHPMAKQWADHASAWVDKTLADEVGAGGEWLCEGSHYGYVSLEPIVAYAVAAKRAGFRDFTNDPRLKKCVEYFAKTHTPPDPMRKDKRSSASFGRGTSGDHFYIFGTAAKMAAESDPAFSQRMQWLYAASGFPGSQPDYRLGGYEDFFADRTLKAAAPDWNSELFPRFAAVLRSHFNTPNESFVNFVGATDSTRNLDIWTPEVGGIAQWFARGKPLSTNFNYEIGYNERHELLRSGVLLARNWGQPADPKTPFGYYTTTKVEGFAALPQLDYARSTFTHTKPDDRDWFPKNMPASLPRVTPAKEGRLEWTRQVLQIKDPEANGADYLVLRDSVRGGQPTAWQFWTLSEKLGGADEAKNADAFLADKPGNVAAAARPLPAGGRYTALGQLGVDVEYFVAAPENTPRHTFRAGGPDNSRVPEFQDALHLQRADDGAYCVVLYPRLRTEAAPVFASLADGKVLKIQSGNATDLVLVSESEASATAEGASLTGTAAAVQKRGPATTLSLGAAGKVKWESLSISATLPASLSVAGNQMTLHVPAATEAGKVTVEAPAGFKAQGNAAGVSVERGVVTVQVEPSSSARTVVLTK